MATPTGYATEETFFATRFRQGGRTVYALELTPEQIINLVTVPDPETATPGNRRVRLDHAKGFANYVRENKDWIIPGMILRAPNIFTFEAKEDVGVEFGLLNFPKRNRNDIHILDGQHRTLGFALALEHINVDIEKAREGAAAAKRNEDKVALREFDKRIKELEVQRNRIFEERVSVLLVIEDDPVAYRQMFFDIADNALGITASVKARFDTRKVVNRALASVLEDAPLLQDRVDLEANSVSRSNPNLMSARHVAEIIRALSVGYDGRFGRRQEEATSEAEVVDVSLRFFRSLVDGFPQFQNILNGQMTPKMLRENSLLGSVLVIRALAAVHYELTVNSEWSSADVTEYFAKLAPHMSAPVTEESIWARHIGEQYFNIGSMAPVSRRQDMVHIVKQLTTWAIVQPDFL